MTRRKAPYWLNFMMLGMECQHVIALRLLRLSKGGAGSRRESSLMMTEKMKAGLKAGRQIAEGASPTTVLKSYRARVRANIRRLSK